MGCERIHLDGILELRQEIKDGTIKEIRKLESRKVARREENDASGRGGEGRGGKVI